MIVDALGLPINFRVTGGQEHDATCAMPLVEETRPTQLLGDRAYDGGPFRGLLARLGCNAVIPPTSGRSQRILYDKELYKARSEVECSFNLLKQGRRFATRYDKTIRNYLAFVALGCISLWLRV
jgi:putative transposase